MRTERGVWLVSLVKSSGACILRVIHGRDARATSSARRVCDRYEMVVVGKCIILAIPKP